MFLSMAMSPARSGRGPIPHEAAQLLRPLAIGLLALQCLSYQCAHAGERVAYDLDPVHTRVMLAVDHAGFSKALGTVSGSTGRLWFDEDDWSTAAVDARIPVSRLDFGDEKWNRATLARNLLDGERFPEARFVSTGIELLADGRARIQGRLTLRGVSRPVTLDAALNAAKRHPLPPFRRTVGFSATAVLSRKDFGIDAWPSVIGDAVELRIELEATRSSDQTTDAGNTRDTRPDSSGDAADPDAKPEPDQGNRDPDTQGSTP